MIAELIGKCKSAEGASDTDVQEALAHQPSSTRSGQCFNACIMESLGLVMKRYFAYTKVTLFERFFKQNPADGR